MYQSVQIGDQFIIDEEIDLFQYRRWNVGFLCRRGFGESLWFLCARNLWSGCRRGAIKFLRKRREKDEETRDSDKRWREMPIGHGLTQVTPPAREPGLWATRRLSVVLLFKPLPEVRGEIWRRRHPLHAEEQLSNACQGRGFLGTGWTGAEVDTHLLPVLFRKLAIVVRD